MKIFMAVIFVLFLSACSDTSILGVKIGGTSDSGGGNGIDNKAYEAYIVDPISLPAFKVHLDGIYQNIQTQFDDPKARGNAISLLTYKTWYIAPIDFVSISKDVLGVSFTSDQTEQLAIQTSKEIWIKKDSFEKMSLKDQSILMVHEFVMNMYFVKYMSMTEICSVTYPASEREQCKALKDLDLLYPREELKPLVSIDYQRIRKVTNFMLARGAFAGRQEINQIFSENEFDKRLFAPIANKPGSPKEFKSTKLLELFDTANTTNTMPNKCYYTHMNQSGDCNFEYLKTTDDSIAANAPALQLSLSASNGVYFSLKTTLLDIHNYYSFETLNPFTREIISLVPLNGPMVRASDVGKKFRSSLLVTSAKEGFEDQSRLKGIVFFSYVMTQVLHETYGDICVLEPFNPTSLADDTIILMNDTKDLKYVEWIAKQWSFSTTCKK